LKGEFALLVALAYTSSAVATLADVENHWKVQR